jgi:hypothetical protein
MNLGLKKILPRALSHDAVEKILELRESYCAGHLNLKTMMA